MLKAVLVALGLGGVSGLVLGIAAKAFAVKDDPRVADVTGMLPGFNCGGCGFAGCSGMAEALVTGKVRSIAGCRASRPATRKAIIEYLSSKPGPDGKTIEVND